MFDIRYMSFVWVSDTNDQRTKAFVNCMRYELIVMWSLP